jgi:hypothetical protein
MCFTHLVFVALGYESWSPITGYCLSKTDALMIWSHHGRIREVITKSNFKYNLTMAHENCAGMSDSFDILTILVTSFSTDIVP